MHHQDCHIVPGGKAKFKKKLPPVQNKIIILPQKKSYHPVMQIQTFP